MRPIIDPITSGTGRALARAHVSPNGLTATGLAMTLACAALIGAGHSRAAGILLIPSVIIDVLDGALARATGRVTAWGGFLDSVSDRVGDGALLAGVAWAASRDDDSRLLAAALVAMVLSFLVPYARAKAEGLGYQTASGPGERPERAVIMILGLLSGLVEAAVWLIALLTAITFVARCLSVKRQATVPVAREAGDS